MYQGSITLIIGPMFSGKTSELLRLKSRTDIAGIKSIIIRYASDTRYGTDSRIYTHDHQSIDCTISAGNSLGKTLSLLQEDTPDLLSTVKYIYIDEIQFYSDAVEICTNLANSDIHVVVAGLSGTFEGIIFENIAKLIPIAEKIKHLTAIDKKSAKNASFTKRLTIGKEIEVIGGSEAYEACDREHFYTPLINDSSIVVDIPRIM